MVGGGGGVGKGNSAFQLGVLRGLCKVSYGVGSRQQWVCTHTAEVMKFAGTACHAGVEGRSPCPPSHGGETYKTSHSVLFCKPAMQK